MYHRNVCIYEIWHKSGPVLKADTYFTNTNIDQYHRFQHQSQCQY